ncbi:hypothetical protein STENM223S_02105 [Streptomyces tendae]
MARRPEATAPGVQNVLLMLGGVLPTVAAIAFTLVSWGHLGIAGRALVLGALTVAALGAPVVLLRRGLRSTAEAVAALGTALTVLDAYALHEVALAGTGAVGYTAAASAVLASLWGVRVATGSPVPPATEKSAAAGAAPAARRARGLRHPVPLAVATAHLPLLLWAVAAGAGPYGLTAVLLATAAASTAVALRTASPPVRVVAVTGASGMGAAGVLSAGWLCWSAPDPGSAVRAAGLLAVAAAVALVTRRFVKSPDVAAAVASAAGLCLVAGTGGVLWVSLPGEWTVPGCLACGIALSAAGRTPLPRPLVRGLVHASMAVQCCAVLWAVPLVAGTVLGPAALGARPWSGTPRDIREAAFTDVSWPPYASTVPLVLAAVTGVLLVAGRTRRRPPHRGGARPRLGRRHRASGGASTAVRGRAGGAGAVVVAALGFAVRSGRADRWPSPPALTALLLALLSSVDLAFLSGLRGGDDRCARLADGPVRCCGMPPRARAVRRAGRPRSRHGPGLRHRCVGRPAAAPHGVARPRRARRGRRLRRAYRPARDRAGRGGGRGRGPARLCARRAGPARCWPWRLRRLTGTVLVWTAAASRKQAAYASPGSASGSLRRVQCRQKQKGWPAGSA